MKVAIGVKVCGLRLNTYALWEMFKRESQYFDTFEHHEFLFPQDAHLIGVAAQRKLQENYDEQAVVDLTHIHFLNNEVAVRKHPWFIEQIERDPVRVLKPTCLDGLRVVDVPDDVEWYLHTADDGSESVHEKHRVWR